MININIVLLLFTVALSLIATPSHGDFLDILRRNPSEADPSTLTVDFLFSRDIATSLSKHSKVILYYEATNPDAAHIKKEKVCHSSTGQIPSFGRGCTEQAVVYKKEFPLSRVNGERFVAHFFRRLEGPGDYLPRSGYVELTKENGDYLSVEFSMMGQWGSKSVVGFPSQPQYIFKLSTSSGELLSAAHSVPYRMTNRDQLYALSSFTKSVSDLDMGFEAKDGNWIVNRDLAMLQPFRQSCYGIPTDAGKSRIPKLWSGYKDLEIQAAADADFTCMSIVGYAVGVSYLRRAVLAVKYKDTMYLSTYELSNLHNRNESLLINAKQGAMHYALQQDTDRHGWQTDKLVYWFPGLEKAYPQHAIAPDNSVVQRLVSEINVTLGN